MAANCSKYGELVGGSQYCCFGRPSLKFYHFIILSLAHLIISPALAGTSFDL